MKNKIKLYPLLNSFFISLFLIIGLTYDKYSSIFPIFHNLTSFSLTILIFFLLNLFIYPFIFILYKKLNNYTLKNSKPHNKVINFIFYQKPFLSMSLFTIIISLIYLYFFYPGTMSFDGNWQLNSYFRYWTWNDHHPALLSMIMANILKLGRLLLNDNFGVFLYIIIEVILNGIIYGYVLKIMDKINSPLILRIITFLILSLLPMWSINSITYIKDTIYYLIFLLLFVFTYYHIYLKKDYKIINFIFIGILYLVLYIFRNTGFYIGIITTLSLSLLLIRENKKASLSFLLIFFTLLGFNSFYQNVFLKMVEAKPSLVREKLSIPLQQTGRYLKNYYDELTDTENVGLTAIFKTDISNIGNLYNPIRSDEVKAEIKDYPTKQELNLYFKSWFIGLKKHPGTYIDATLNNTYAYLYSKHKNFIGEELGFYTLNNMNPDLDLYFNDDTASGRAFLTNIAEFICNFPLLGLLYSCFPYVWILLTLTLYLLSNKKYQILVYIIPLYLNLLFCFISPVNGHMRYLAPLAVSILPLIAFTLNENNLPSSSKI